MKKTFFLIIVLSIALTARSFNRIDTIYQAIDKKIIATSVTYRTMQTMQNYRNIEFTDEETASLMAGDTVYVVLVELMFSSDLPFVNNVVQGFALENNIISPVTAKFNRSDRTKNDYLLVILLGVFIVSVVIAGKSAIKNSSRKKTFERYVRFMAVIVSAVALGFAAVGVSSFSEITIFNKPSATLVLLILFLFIMHVINNWSYVGTNIHKDLFVTIIPTMAILLIFGHLPILGGITVSTWSLVAAIACCLVGWLIYEGLSFGVKRITSNFC